MQKDLFHSVVNQPDEVFDKSDLNSLKINGFTLEELKNGKEENGRLISWGTI